MSAPEVTEKLVAAINEDRADFYIVNFANCDMVGHTGVFDAAVKAVEAVDDALSKVVPAILAKGGFALITADHGNADHMFDVASDGSKHPFTAHTTNRVPFIIVDEKAQLTGIEDGRLRLQIVGSDLGGSDEHALLALLGLLDAAVEEERHVGVLLGLGGVQLLQAIGGDNVGQDVLGERLGEGDLDIKRRIVLGHRHKVRKLDLLALKAVELLVREHAGHLTSAVGTEVEEDGRVALVDALVVGSEGLDELVAARVLLVVGLDAGNGVDIGIGRIDHDVVGTLDALPTVVAVHGPIAARNGGDASVATGLLGNLSQEGAELAHVTDLLLVDSNLTNGSSSMNLSVSMITIVSK